VVSGGARGIDGAAHRGALAAGAPTLAYLGVAVDRIYPSRHRPLFARILRDGGALVSEHPPRATTRKWAHADRNRFIAAQSRRIYVAEADEGSGSLGTTDWANRLGVEVLVSPPGVAEKRAGLDALVAAGRARFAEAMGPGAGR